MFGSLGIGFYICIAAVILVGLILILYVVLYVNRKGKIDGAEHSVDHPQQENETGQQTEEPVTQEAKAQGEAAVTDASDAVPADSFVIVKKEIVTGTDEIIS